MSDMKLAAKIEFLIKKTGIRKAEVARMIGVAPARITEWSKDERTPSLQQAAKLARVFGVPLEFLADDDADEPSPAAEGLSDGEQWLLRMFRSSGLTPEKAITRMVSRLAEPD